MEKSIEEMIGGYVWADPTEAPTVMHVHEVSTNGDGVRERHVMTPTFIPQEPRVNADADADADADRDTYVETLQTIVVEPHWIDSIVNEGRPYFCRQDSPPSHKPLKIRDRMVECSQMPYAHCKSQILLTPLIGLHLDLTLPQHQRAGYKILQQPKGKGFFVEVWPQNFPED
ncbi:hypothetical protein ACTXT7_008503 [Hymenolepis weldensis]